MNPFCCTEHLFCIKRCAGARSLKRSNNSSDPQDFLPLTMQLKWINALFMKLTLITPNSLETLFP